ncbi:hypothetical protein SAMN05443639_12662 [Stigmatella erecta]|uniref:Uncharacterized protein n=2 Tax=Stigmatella erecta TaxID=83460 RepID=A0A1I0LFI9_9BACT|nr:hypothetical protein SAMN05443639_12662 [Stigmatella erecta]
MKASSGRSQPRPFPHYMPILLGTAVLFTGVHGFNWTAQEARGVLLADGLLLLVALADIWHWRQRRRLFQQHPHEPWRWETSWKQLLRPRVSWGDYVGPILAVLFLLLVTTAVLESLYRILGLAFMLPALLGLLALAGHHLVRHESSLWKKMRRELRPGQPSLRLESIPLALGTPCQVHVVSRPGLPAVDTVTVRLTRTRERRETVRFGGKSKTQVHRTVEYEHSQKVDAKALREHRDLGLLLDLPKARRENATVWHGDNRCFWDLEVSFDGSGLRPRYRLPVYSTQVEKPGADRPQRAAAASR